MLTDFGARRIIIKIVYFGCAMSGKTTSIRCIFDKFGASDALQSIETRAGRTLFFDCGSLQIQKGQWTFEISVWSATGQDFYAETRPTVLSGVDGIVFVADSQSLSRQANFVSWNELGLLLGPHKKKIPIVISLNKRDFQDAISVRELKNLLKINEGIEIFETVASQGLNVANCFQRIIEKIFHNP